MKLGDFFIQLGVKGDTKKLNETIRQLEEAEKATRRQIKYQQDLAKAETEEQKALIRKNYYQNKALDLAKKEKAGLDEHKHAMLGVAKGITAFVAGIALAYNAVDRMVNSLASANAIMIAFQRQTGISFASLNKYASASAMVNYNSTPEQVANTMQTLAQNLYDIRMGRGDISPYQELSFVGGKSFNPLGLTVEQLIENVREAIKGVNDVQATNIITRMGFSPDDLLMLRMTREEFEKINDLFLNPKEREQMNAYSLQVKKMRLEFTLMKDRAILALMPLFIKFTKYLRDFSTLWLEAGKNILNVVNASKALGTALKVLLGIGAVIFAAFHPLITLFSALYLIIEDIVGYFMGKESVTGFIVNGIQDIFNNIKIPEIKTPKFLKTITDKMFGTPEIDIAPGGNINNSSTNNNINQSNNITVHTNEAGEYIIDTVNNMSVPLRQAVAPMGY